MKKHIVILIFLLSTTSIYAQDQRSIVSFRLNLRTNSLLIPVCYRFIVTSKPYIQFMKNHYIPFLINMSESNRSTDHNEYGTNKNSGVWIFVLPYLVATIPPNLEYDIHTPSYEVYDNGKFIETSRPYIWRNLLLGDYSHNYNFAAGGTMYLHPRSFPLSLGLGINWESRAICISDGNMMGRHRSAGATPHLILNYHFVNDDYMRPDNWDFVCSIGTSYVHILGYDGPLDGGKSILNNGWRGQIGISLQHGFESYSVRYEYDFYNYFKIPDVTTRMNSLVFSYCMNFGAAYYR